MNGVRKKYITNRLTDEQKNFLKDYIQKNPTNTYTQFVIDIKGKVKCSDAHYYMIKRNLLGMPSSRAQARPRTASRSPLYMTVWSIPSNKCPEVARVVLEDFISTMNGLRRSRFEVIEMKSPAIIEVRETHIRG